MEAQVLSPAVRRTVKCEFARARHRIPRNEHDDALQEVWLAVVKAAPRFDPGVGTGLNSFVKLRVRGALMDYLREVDPLTRDQRRKVKSGAAAPIAFTGADALRSIPIKPLQEREVLAREVREAVNRLRPLLRYTITRIYFDGLTYAELARERGVGIDAVNQVALRARRELLRFFISPRLHA